MINKKKRYWHSFDLGLRGNYEELYVWLDNMNASECGENLATFFSGKTTERISKELAELLGKNARIYLVGDIDGKFRGKFFLGRRKRPPWAGYGGPKYTSQVDST